MNTISLSNFLLNAEYIITNTIYNNEINIIKTEDGNAFILSEQEFNSLLNSIHKTNLFNKIE